MAESPKGPAAHRGALNECSVKAIELFECDNQGGGMHRRGAAQR